MKITKYLILFCGIFLFCDSAFASPVITFITPSYGSASGGQTVVVHGTGFSGCTGTINGSPITSSICKSSSLTGTAPSGTPGVAITRVTNSDLTYSESNEYYYTGYSTTTLDTLSTYTYLTIVYFIKNTIITVWPFVCVFAILMGLAGMFFIFYKKISNK